MLINLHVKISKKKGDTLVTIIVLEFLVEIINYVGVLVHHFENRLKIRKFQILPGIIVGTKDTSIKYLINDTKRWGKLPNRRELLTIAISNIFMTKIKMLKE